MKAVKGLELVLKGSYWEKQKTIFSAKQTKTFFGGGANALCLICCSVLIKSHLITLSIKGSEYEG